MLKTSPNNLKIFLLTLLVCCQFLSSVECAALPNFPCIEIVSGDQCRHCPTSFNVTKQSDLQFMVEIQVECNQTSLECTWMFNDSASFGLPQNAYVTVYGWSDILKSYSPSPGCCDVGLEVKRCEMRNCSKVSKCGITVGGKLLGVPAKVTTIGSCATPVTEEPRRTKDGDFIPFDKFDTENVGSNPTAYHFYAIVICLVGSLLLAFASVFCYFQQKRNTIEKSSRNQEFRRSKVVRKSAAPSISTSEKNSDPTRTSFLQEW